MIGAGVLDRAVAAACARHERTSGDSTGLVNLSTKAARSKLFEADQVLGRVRKMARTVDHSAREIHFSCSRLRVRPLFVTLTYRPGVEWEAGHVRHFVRRCRDWFRHRGVSMRMVWVAELQKRGAVHYHAVIWVPTRFRLPAPDRCGWWPWGMSNVQRARAPIGYLVKYASKGVGDGQHFPRGCRTYGHCGLSKESRVVVRYWCAPVWVRDGMRKLGAWGADLRRCKGGWVDRLTGLFLASPWRIWMPGNGHIFFYKVGSIGA